MIICLQM